MNSTSGFGRPTRASAAPGFSCPKRAGAAPRHFYSSSGAGAALEHARLLVWSSIKIKGPDPGLNKLKFDLAGIALGKHLARLWVLNSGTNRWL